jgi:hypothetical protein
LTVNAEERRRFSRFMFDARAILHSPSGDIETGLVDISLKGALISRRADFPPLSAGEIVTLDVVLADGATHIQMLAEVVHISMDNIGLRRTNIDMDSIGHLRRLVELNLGDTELLERELEALG